MPSSTELDHTAEHVERTAQRDLVRAGAEIGLDLESCEVSGATVLRSRRFGHLLFNRALGLAPGNGAQRAAVGDVLASLESCPAGYLVHVARPERAAELVHELEHAGLVRYRRTWIKFHRGRELVTEVHTPYAIEPADVADAGAASAILASGFDMPEALTSLLAALIARPGWFWFVARADDELAGAGAMFVHERSAYLAFAATVPMHRGRGVQRALMTARIERALELGCTSIFTETGEALPGEPNHSEANMRRCGFSPLLTVANFAPAGTDWLRAASTCVR